MGSQCLRTGRFGRSTSTTRSPQACRARGNPVPCDRVPSSAHTIRGPGAWERGEVEQRAVAGGVR